jgi:ATP-dependent Lhr-like helicase
VGSVIPGERVPRLAGTRVLYRDGVPVASLVGGEPRILEDSVPDAARLLQVG